MRVRGCLLSWDGWCRLPDRRRRRRHQHSLAPSALGEPAVVDFKHETWLPNYACRYRPSIKRQSDRVSERHIGIRTRICVKDWFKSNRARYLSPYSLDAEIYKRVFYCCRHFNYFEQRAFQSRINFIFLFVLHNVFYYVSHEKLYFKCLWKTAVWHELR